MIMGAISRRRRLLAGAIAAVGVAATVGLTLASDHNDTPLVELNPTMDLVDFFAFPGSSAGRIVLVQDSRGFITPAQAATVSFDRNLLYQFKVDNDGDNIEDKVIQVTFSGSGSDQRVQVRGPIDPPVTGAMQNEVAEIAPGVEGPINTVLGSAGGMQVFAGVRKDPHFFDLEAAFCVLPDRAPVAGELSQPCSLPADPAPPFYFRPVGQAENYLDNYNVLAIVVELPSAQLEAGAPGKLGLWATISQ